MWYSLNMLGMLQIDSIPKVVKYLTVLLFTVYAKGDEGPLTNSACIGSGSGGGDISGFMFQFSCPEGMVIRIQKTISYSKPKSVGCPEYYDSSREDCCVFNEGDCGGLDIDNNQRHYDNCNGKNTCSSPATRMLTPTYCFNTGRDYPLSTNYVEMEYYCIPENSVIITPGNGTTNGSTVNIENEDYPDPVRNATEKLICSVETSCNSTIIVTAVDVRYTFTDGVCDQRLHIVDEYGAVNAYTQCKDLPYTEYVLYQSTTNFIKIQASREDFIYWIKFQASLEGAISILSCGADAKEKPTCIPAGDLGSNCTTNADCMVNGGFCNSEGICVCNGQLTEYKGKCVADKEVGGRCQGFIDCLRETGSYCLPIYPSNCICFDGTTDVDGTCMNDGEVGGVCNAGTVSGCNDENAECKDWVCLCAENFTLINETCKKDGQLGGSCNDRIACTITNAECNEGICRCNERSSEADGICKSNPGYPGGDCSSSTDCTDTNSECVDGTCVCRNDYLNVDAICIPDGILGGRCINGSGCSITNADCIEGICRCNERSTDVDGVCKSKPGYPDGECSSSADCFDINSECVGGTCICTDDYHNIDAFCVQDGVLHGRCISGTKCSVTNADCIEGICKCNERSSEVDGTCKSSPGYPGGNCSSSEDCIDKNSECEGGTCNCTDNYSNVDAICVQDGMLGGICIDGSECNVTNADCIDGICRCNERSSEVVGVCKSNPGYPGGNCSSSEDCIDINSECKGDTCNCTDDFSNIDAVCVQDGVLHGRCISENICSVTNADCIESICRCNERSSEVDGICKSKPGYPGGNCATSEDCIDKNSECVGGTCNCTDNYSNVDALCYQNGGLGGRCINGNRCSITNADCIEGICRCNERSSEVDGVCTSKPGYPGGNCSSSEDCIDKNSECVGGTCNCTDNYSNVDTICYQDGLPGGRCTNGARCTITNADCIEGICRCNERSSKVEGTCKSNPGYPGGKCSSSANCTDKNSECIGGTCNCINNYSNIDAVCVKDGMLGGLCINESACNIQNVDCIDGICICNERSMAVGGACQGTVRLGEECFDAVDCAENTVCEENVCQCHDGFKSNNEVCVLASTLHGPCSEQENCVQANTICEGNVCGCAEGLEESGGECVQKAPPWAIIIPLLIVAILGVAALLFFLCRDRIKRKLCPEKQPLKSEPVITPMSGTDTTFNTKYPPHKRPQEEMLPKDLLPTLMRANQLPPLTHQGTVKNLLQNGQVQEKKSLANEEETLRRKLNRQRSSLMNLLKDKNVVVPEPNGDALPNQKQPKKSKKLKQAAIKVEAFNKLKQPFLQPQLNQDENPYLHGFTGFRQPDAPPLPFGQGNSSNRLLLPAQTGKDPKPTFTNTLNGVHFPQLPSLPFVSEQNIQENGGISHQDDPDDNSTFKHPEPSKMKAQSSWRKAGVAGQLIARPTILRRKSTLEILDVGSTDGNAEVYESNI